jgi:hypothetical protein
MLDGVVLRHLALDLYRIVLALLLVGACLPAGAWVRRVWGGRTEPLFDLGVGFGVVAALLRLLAFLGVATRAGVLTLMAVLAIGGVATAPLLFKRWREGRQPEGGPPAKHIESGTQVGEEGGKAESLKVPKAVRWFSFQPSDLSAFGSSAEPTSRAKRGAPLWALAIALPALLMALAPPASFDEVSYHLRIPQVALHTGSWPFDGADSATSYPSATEALYLPALALDPSGIVAQLVHFAFFVLLLLAVGRLAGVYAILLIGSIPALGIAGGWALADAPLLFLLACAAIALRDGERSDVFALLGCATAVKLSALLFGLPLAVLAVRRDAWRGFACGLLVAAPWYVPHRVTVSGANMQWDQSWLAYFTRPEGLDNDLGGLLLFVMLGVALLALRRAESRLPAIIAIAMIAVITPFHPAGRVLLPAVVAVLVVAAGELARMPAAGGLLAALFVVRGLAVIVGHNALFFNPAPVAVGLESEDTYIGRNAPFRAYYRKLSLPPDARVLVIGEPRLFDFPAPTSGAGLPDPPAIRPFLAAGGDLSGRLRAAGFTHIFVDLASLNGATTMVNRRRDIAVTSGERLALEALMHASQPVARSGERWLFKIR